MAVEYTLVISDALGAVKSIAVDYLELVINRNLNKPDVALFSFDSTSPNVQFLETFGFIQIIRKDDALGIVPTTEFQGFINRITKVRGERTTFTVTCLGMLALLATRTVAWRADIANRSKWTARPAETILKDMFNYNIGSLATTANGRLLNGNMTGMTTTASAGLGTVLSIAAAYENLLTAMQRVAEGSSSYFTLTYAVPFTWTFAFYPTLQGTDRRTTVKLSVDNGTLSEFVYDIDYAGDFNAVIVGGEGQGAARRIATRPAALPTGYNLRETFLDSRKGNKATLATLQNEGTALLRQQTRKRIKYNANGVLQTASLRYGRDYFLGDYVTVGDSGVEVAQIINAVTLEFKNGEELIDVEFISL